MLSIGLTQEICDNRIDDDGDGLIDCMDPDCDNYTDCWECIAEFYQVHSNSTLVALDPVYGTYEVLATISGAEQINGLQFNHLDGHVYAPCIINGQHRLGMLSPSGVVTDMGLDLPGNGIFYVGAIDANGVFYLANGSGLFKVDLMKSPLEVVDTGVRNLSVADFSLDITRALFYGITSSSKLRVYDPATNQLSTYDLAGSINNESGAFGAAWSCVDGSFYAYNNSSGKIYSVDVNDLTATEVLNATGNLSINDGFNCVLAPPPFESNCNNGIDDDGDGLVDCDDPDCDKSNQCTVEICDNGIDDDGDGWADCSDSECYALQICIEICDNGIDDNGNGLVDGDDPQCTTSSGVRGGLESNRRLADKITQRNFNIVKSPTAEFQMKLKGEIPFQGAHFKNNFDIGSFIPVDAIGNYTSESSPNDLIGITNAIEVTSADYFYDQQRLGSILAIKSENGVYEHTKYICDRLDGARLLDISYLNVFGGTYVAYELMNKYGQVEYSVSFAGYYKEEVNAMYVESHWNIHKYADEDVFYNFQVWANSYQNLIELMQSLLEKMHMKVGVKGQISSYYPKVFIQQADYVNGAIRLVIKNKARTKQLNIQAHSRDSEVSTVDKWTVSMPLEGRAEEIIYVETDGIYDVGMSIQCEESPADEIFLADGAWGISNDNPNALIHNFEIEQSQGSACTDCRQIERNIHVEADVKDYLNIYRSLNAKFVAENLNAFSSLEFEAQGNGLLEVCLVKSSITDWSEQHKAYVELNEDGETVELSWLDFVAGQKSLDNLSDINMLVFTLIGEGGVTSERVLDLSDVRFVNNTITSSTEAIYSSEFEVSPNPFSSELNLTLPDSKEVSVVIYDQLGKEIYTLSNINNDRVAIDTRQWVPGLYFAAIYDQKGHKQTKKIIKK